MRAVVEPDVTWHGLSMVWMEDPVKLVRRWVAVLRATAAELDRLVD